MEANEAVERLKRTGFVRLRVPTCEDELPKFFRKVEHIEKQFEDLEQREVERNGRLWFEFTVRQKG